MISPVENHHINLPKGLNEGSCIEINTSTLNNISTNTDNLTDSTQVEEQFSNIKHGTKF